MSNEVQQYKSSIKQILTETPEAKAALLLDKARMHLFDAAQAIQQLPHPLEKWAKDVDYQLDILRNLCYELANSARAGDISNPPPLRSKRF